MRFYANSSIQNIVMLQHGLEKIKKMPGLKKRILEKAIIARCDIEWDFPLHWLMYNSNFKEISKGRFNLTIDGMEICNNVKTELIEVVNDLVKKDLLKFTKLGCICPSGNFKKRYHEDVVNDIGYDFIWPDKK